MNYFYSALTTVTHPAFGYTFTAPALAVAYPAAHPTPAQDSTPAAGTRVCLRVDDPPDALLADSRFPRVRADDEPDPASFASYQNAMLSAVDVWYAAQLAAGFAFNGVVYPLDADSREQWHGLLTLSSQLSFPLSITAADGRTVISADKDTALALAGAALSAFVAIGQTAAGVRKNIAAAQSVTDLDAITWG
jgi:hypothetical protein